DLPVFSLGCIPSGPRRLDPRPSDALASAACGEFRVDAAHWAACDDDGVVFAPLADAGRILEVAEKLSAVERAQADAIRSGRSLRGRIRFAEYLGRRRSDPSYTLRRHLKRVGGAIEE